MVKICPLVWADIMEFHDPSLGNDPSCATLCNLAISFIFPFLLCFTLCEVTADQINQQICRKFRRTLELFSLIVKTVSLFGVEIKAAEVDREVNC